MEFWLILFGVSVFLLPIIGCIKCPAIKPYIIWTLLLLIASLVVLFMLLISKHSPYDFMVLLVAIAQIVSVAFNAFKVNEVKNVPNAMSWFIFSCLPMILVCVLADLLVSLMPIGKT